MGNLTEQFLQRWTLEKIQAMTLEQYTSTGENRDDFTFWIENKMGSVLSIWGGSSYKFGIYKRHSDSAFKEGRTPAKREFRFLGF